MLDLVGPTVGQAECQGGLDSRVQGATEPGASSQQGARPATHHAGVPEWVTDGQVAVIGHDCVEETLGAPQEVEGIELCYTALEGEGPATRGHQGHQHFGHRDSGEPHVDEGQVGEEAVHGGVEARVHADHQQDEEVPQHGEDVDHQEDARVWSPGLVCGEGL